MGDMGDLVGHHGAAAAGMLGPAEDARLEEGAVDDQLAPPLEQISRLALPAGVSNSYAFVTSIQGIRRRSAAKASRARVSAFSFTSSCWRAASQACGDTTGGCLHGGLSAFLLR